MDRSLIAILGFVALFVLMTLRVPIGVAMAIVGVGGFASINGLERGLNLLMHSPLRTATDYTLSVVPMFVLMGVFATASGMSRELYRAATAWVGHVRGGLALSTIFACAGFSAINGSSVATAATMSTVALPEMRRAGYEPGLAAGVIAAGGTLGIMIPPSVILLIYGIMTEQNISALFAAGILPGILAIVLYALVIRLLAWRQPHLMPGGVRQGWDERLASLRDIWPTVLLFAAVLAGIYGGFVTITEAASLGAVGAFVIGFVRGRLPPRVMIDCLATALRITASIFMVAIGAYLFGYFLAITQTTQTLTRLLTELPIDPYGVLAIILVGYIILGALMDELAMILLTVPIVFPAIVALGFDPVWFGVIIVMTCTLGLVAPPVGMNVFVINSIARDIRLTTIYRGVMPFFAIDILRLVILCAFPSISLFLPRLLM